MLLTFLLISPLSVQTAEDRSHPDNEKASLDTLARAIRTYGGKVSYIIPLTENQAIMGVDLPKRDRGRR